MNTQEDSPIVSAPVPADAFGLEPLLDVTELTAYLGVPVSTHYDWRTRGKGPAAYRFGKHLEFAVSDVRASVAEQRESA
jgi:predicted DNA-binding transcriptional regulator AlpA